MHTIYRGFVILALILFGCSLLLEAGGAANFNFDGAAYFDGSGLRADSLDHDGDAGSNNPSIVIELGAETFMHHDFSANAMIGGLAAIMIDIDGHLNDSFSFFGAFHFDTSPWHDFLNEPFDHRQDAGFAYDVELEVEEFFVDWDILPEHLELRAGRRFSRFSYANQLHLADFQFNMKPRIFTSYWGNNHGLAIDGLSLSLSGEAGPAKAVFFAEAAKNGLASAHTMITTVLDTRFDLGGLDLGVRGFAYFDHQTENHPLLFGIDETRFDLINLHSGLGLNAWGMGVSSLWDLHNGKALLLQSEWVNRKLGDDFLLGMYAFLQFDFSEKLSASAMYQQLEMPVLSNDRLITEKEQAYTLGVSWFPLPEHRLRLEYNHFNNSAFYNKMILLKYTFFFML